jgi:hypothetical protein
LIIAHREKVPVSSERLDVLHEIFWEKDDRVEKPFHFAEIDPNRFSEREIKDDKSIRVERNELVFLEIGKNRGSRENNFFLFVFIVNETKNKFYLIFLFSFFFRDLNMKKSRNRFFLPVEAEQSSLCVWNNDFFSPKTKNLRQKRFFARRMFANKNSFGNFFPHFIEVIMFHRLQLRHFNVF